MKTKVVSSFVAAFVLLVSYSAMAEVHFKELSFDAAKKQAVKEKKKVMIDFYTDWCGWCKVLDRKTYSDEEVGKTADANFISIKIDAEKGEGIALAKQYKISGYPTILFFSADGQELDRVVGYQDAGHFQRSMTLAANGGTRAILDEVNSKKDLKDAQKLLVAAEYYEEQHDNAKALDLLTRASALDQDDKLKIREEAQYHLAFLTKGDDQWKALEQAVMQYPMRAEGQQATMYLLQHAFQSEHPEQDAARLVEFWVSRHPDDINVMNYFAWSAAEKGVLLDQAEELATRAVGIADTPTEKATIMDTRAEVLFKLNKAQEALNQEEAALALLNPSKDAKLFKDLSAQKVKFQAGLTAPASNGPVSDPSVGAQ